LLIKIKVEDTIGTQKQQSAERLAERRNNHAHAPLKL
jgi:hypothetical protein